ncbi:MAG: hypothetical protein ABIU97_07170, partial [Dehalococcoidia bacterium]
MNGKRPDQVTGWPHPARHSRALPFALATLLMGVLFFADSPPAFAAPYVVDTTSDTILTACTGAAGDCSLRGAVSNASAPGADTITFDATVFPNPYGGSFTLITLGTTLSVTGSDTTIDATTTGVTLNASSPYVSDCLDVSGANSVIVGIDQINACANGIVVSGNNIR